MTGPMMSVDTAGSIHTRDGTISERQATGFTSPTRLNPLPGCPIAKTSPPSKTQPIAERLANCAFALNVWAWAVLGVTNSPPDERYHAVRLCISSMHIVVGVLFLVRGPVRQAGSMGDLATAVPAIVLSGAVFAASPSCATWHPVAVGLFIFGTAIAIVSMLALAKNFAVLPAVRGVTSTGPYRLIRHPLYLGELTLIVACTVAGTSLLTVSIFIATSAAVAWRIRSEERLLQSADVDVKTAYYQYCQTTRYRLIPYVW